MRFQPRDGEILWTIYENQGVMSLRQLKTLFWPDKSWRAIERRILKLIQAEYLARPNRDQHRNHPIPEPICWLGWRGVLYIAGLFGISVAPPKIVNENQLRVFQKALRGFGINWFREPRWSLLGHDLVVVDFKLAVEKEVSEIPQLAMEKWIYETEFRSDPDVISYEITSRDGIVKHLKKRVLPDAYFEIVDEEQRSKGERYRARFLLEIDMSTHDNPSFGREKAVPGKAYIRSSAYRARFGCNSGRWLVITKGQKTRLKNLMKQTQQNTGKYGKLFFFTSLISLEYGYPLTSPIWKQADKNEPMALFKI